MATMAVPQRTTHATGATGVSVSNPAATRDQRYRTLQVVLFAAGAILMPLGIIAIMLGWYGVAHTKYQYDQLPYVVSGGLLGVGLVMLGGFCTSAPGWRRSRTTSGRAHGRWPTRCSCWPISSPASRGRRRPPTPLPT